MSLQPARAWQLEQWGDDIDADIQNLKKSRDANKRYVDKTANHSAEDFQIGYLTLMHETKIEQSHRTKPDARWPEHYRVTEIAQCLGTYQWPELDEAELVG